MASSRQIRQGSSVLWAFLPIVCLVGCAVDAGFDYRPPPVPPSFAPANTEAASNGPSQAADGPAAEEEGKPAAVEMVKSPDGPLSLDQLIQIALENQPDLAIAYAQAEIARGRLVQAGLYPNPTLSWAAQEMGNPENNAGFQGFQVNQTIVTADKLELAQAAAAQGVRAADWMVIRTTYDLITRVRAAYFEALTAQRQLDVATRLVGIAEDGLKTARKVIQANLGAKPDEIRATIELNQTRLLRIGAERRLEAAWKVLAASVGVPDLPRTRLVDHLDAPPPEYEWPVLIGIAFNNAEVRAAQAAIVEAEWALRLAQVQPIPNINLAIQPTYSFPDEAAELNLQIGVQLPVFNRNQGNIIQAQAELAARMAAAQQVQLNLQQRLAQAFRVYQEALAQVEIQSKQIVPQARESLRLVREGYAAGLPPFDYTTVLQAQQTLARAELDLVQAKGNLWQAIAEIAGILQQDRLETPPVHPSKKPK